MAQRKSSVHESHYDGAILGIKGSLLVKTMSKSQENEALS